MDSTLTLVFVPNKRLGMGVVFLRDGEQEGHLGVEDDPGLWNILFHNRTEEAVEVPRETPGSQDVERELVLRRWTWGPREGPGRLGALDSTSPMTQVGPERRGERLGTTEQPGKSSSEEGDPESGGARGGTRLGWGGGRPQAQAPDAGAIKFRNASLTPENQVRPQGAGKLSTRRRAGGQGASSIKCTLFFKIGNCLYVLKKAST